MRSLREIPSRRSHPYPSLPILIHPVKPYLSPRPPSLRVSFRRSRRFRTNAVAGTLFSGRKIGNFRRRNSGKNRLQNRSREALRERVSGGKNSLTKKGAGRTLCAPISGCSAVWLAHLHGVQRVGGSNPLSPTISPDSRRAACPNPAGFCFFARRPRNALFLNPIFVFPHEF